MPPCFDKYTFFFRCRTKLAAPFVIFRGEREMLAVCIKRTPKWHFWFFFACLDIQWVSEREKQQQQPSTDFTRFPLFFPLCCCSRIFFSFHFKSINVNDVQLYISLLSLLFNLYCVFSPPFLFVFVRYNFLYFFSHERDFLDFTHLRFWMCLFEKNALKLI